MPPWPKLCTNAFDTVFQPVGIMIGTSVGLGIAWTDSGWRDGGRWWGGDQGDKIQQSLFEKLVEGPFKKRSLADSVPQQKINASTCKD